MTAQRNGLRVRSRRVLMAAFGFTLAADVISKAAVQHFVGESSLSLLGDFQLRVLYNSRAPWGLGHTGPGNAILVAVAVVVVALLIWAWKANRRESLAIGITAGGATGNLIDRLIGGSVLDWIDPGLGGVFNLADLAIVTGLFLLVTSSGDHELRARPRSLPAEPG